MSVFEREVGKSVLMQKCMYFSGHTVVLWIFCRPAQTILELHDRFLHGVHEIFIHIDVRALRRLATPRSCLPSSNGPSPSSLLLPCPLTPLSLAISPLAVILIRDMICLSRRSLSPQKPQSLVVSTPSTNSHRPSLEEVSQLQGFGQKTRVDLNYCKVFM